MATPSLALIPSGYKAQKVYSVLPTNGDGDFTFARSGTATRVNQSGLIETVGNNVPRLDYSDGGCPSLLLEPERTNLVTYSEDFTQWGIYNSTITPNSAISPDGTQNASLFSHSGGSFPQAALSGITFVSGSDYIPSLYVKSDGTSQVQHSLLVNNIVVNFTPTDEWVRISDLIVSPDTSGSFVIAQNSGSAVPASFYIWGAQLEQGSYASSYIPTNGSVVTRSAEITNGAGNTSTFNDSQGVLYAEVKGFEEVPSDSGYIAISSPSVSFTNAVVLQFRSNGDLRFYFGGSASANIQFIDSTIDFTENNKIAVQYDSNGSNYKMFVNGVSISRYGPATNQSVTGLSELNFNYGSALSFIGEVKDVRVYNNALTDAQLQALTQ